MLMSKASNKKKNDQLGMNHGTASHRLRKMIMFDLVAKLSLNICHQCGEAITNIKELSIEHKTPWLDSDDPVDLFFSLDNIAFSHFSCNTLASRTPWAYTTQVERDNGRLAVTRAYYKKNRPAILERRRARYRKRVEASKAKKQ
jgi:hypothetical protein